MCQKEDIVQMTLRYLEASVPGITPYEREKVLADWRNKEKSATYLLADFEKRIGTVKGSHVLEVGFGTGYQSIAFAGAGAIVVGLEVNTVLVDIARANAAHASVPATFVMYEGSRMPFEDATFDYVVSTSVFEHVDNLPLMIREIHRVLRPGGRAYISFPNRLAPRETHTGMLFLHYLPYRVAVPLFRLFGTSLVDTMSIHFLTYWSVKRLLPQGLHVLPEGAAHTASRRAAKRIFSLLGMHHSAVLKTVMIVLEKESS